MRAGGLVSCLRCLSSWFALSARVRTRSCPLIRSAHFKVTDHECTDPPFYDTDPFYGALRMKEVSNFVTISFFPVPLPLDRPYQLLWIDLAEAEPQIQLWEHWMALWNRLWWAAGLWWQHWFSLNEKNATKTSLPQSWACSLLERHFEIRCCARTLKTM